MLYRDIYLLIAQYLNIEDKTRFRLASKSIYNTIESVSRETILKHRIDKIFSAIERSRGRLYHLAYSNLLTQTTVQMLTFEKDITMDYAIEIAERYSFGELLGDIFKKQYKLVRRNYSNSDEVLQRLKEQLGILLPFMVKNVKMDEETIDTLSDKLDQPDSVVEQYIIDNIDEIIDEINTFDKIKRWAYILASW